MRKKWGSLLLAALLMAIGLGAAMPLDTVYAADPTVLTVGTAHTGKITIGKKEVFSFTTDADKAYYSVSCVYGNGANGFLWGVSAEIGGSYLEKSYYSGALDLGRQLKASTTYYVTFDVTYAESSVEYLLRVNKYRDDIGDTASTGKKIEADEAVRAAVYTDDLMTLVVSATADKSGSYTADLSDALKSGKTYYIKVTGEADDFGAVPYALKLTTYKAPTKVAALKLSAVKDKVKLSWKKQAGSDGYEIYRATSKNGYYSLVGETTGKIKCRCDPFSFKSSVRFCHPKLYSI